MDCRKTQRLLDELAEGRVAAPLAEQLRRHLTECSDCRVAQQRAARLRRMLALKRYEQPAPAYFQGFLDEFHQRLQAETASPASLWTWLKAQWEGFQKTAPVWTLRYGLSGAAGVLLVAGVASWMVVHQTRSTVAKYTTPSAIQNTNDVPSTGGSPVLVAQGTPPDSLPIAGGSDIPTDPTTQTILVPATQDTETGEPSYVLDHLTITPASYEGPRVNF